MHVSVHERGMPWMSVHARSRTRNYIRDGHVGLRVRIVLVRHYRQYADDTQLYVTARASVNETFRCASTTSLAVSYGKLSASQCCQDGSGSISHYVVECKQIPTACGTD